MHYYPINLNIGGRKCVVVGGGRVAERKVKTLLRFEGEVLVISPDITEGLQRLVEEGKVGYLKRRYSSGVLAGAFLAFAATSSRDVNARIARDAHSLGVPVNVADSAAESVFILPAILERDGVVIAVSTGGRSPALAKKVRDQVAKLWAVLSLPGREKTVITIGTRGSRLALAQTEEVKKLLEGSHPGLEAAVRVIRTRGDRGVRGGKGLFVKELEQMLLVGEIDLAIHSAKDLPGGLPAGLILGAVPKRLDPRDALISRGGLKLEKLPRGAKVGTGSPRRRALLLHLRPDLEVVGLRGNLDTRLAKLGRGGCDAIVVAFCGLMRLGWQGRVTQVLEPKGFLPAVGQGALGIEIRGDDERIRQLVEPLNHAPSWAEVMAERSFLRAMGGGCQLPLAALGRTESDRLVLSGLVASPDGKQVAKETVWGSPFEGEMLGRALARRLRKARLGADG